MKDWVDIKHMLPKSGKIVLVSDGKFVTDGMLTSGNMISLTAIIKDDEITHWMDKPGPPTEKIQ
jgi:hypothetical protein